MWTNDIERLSEFYRRYFKGSRSDRYSNNKSGFESYFMTFEDGARLEIMSRPGLTERRGDPSGAGYSHIAFSAGCRQAVIDLTQEIKKGGYAVLTEPRITGDGYFESTVSDPDGNIVEITE